MLKKTAVISPERSKLHQWLQSEENIEKTEASPILKKEISNPETIVEKINESDEIKKDLTQKKTENIEQSTLKQEINVQKEFKETSVEQETTGSPETPKKLEVEEASKEKLPENLSFLEWIEWIKNNDPGSLQDLESKSTFEDKIDLIDSFLKNNPKIPPVSANTPKQNLSKDNTFDKEELMTETLAKVYVKQGKFKKALLSYKILSLKYPEKNSFFADQIKAIKELQQK